MNEQRALHPTLKLFGYEMEVLSDGKGPNGDRIARAYRASRFPFSGIVQEKADGDFRKVTWMGHLTVFNVPVPLAEIEFDEGHGPEAVIKALEFQACSLAADMAWFSQNRSSDA